MADGRHSSPLITDLNIYRTAKLVVDQHGTAAPMPPRPCHKPFVSEWVGERVCKRCKSTSVWREGKASFPNGAL